MIRCSTNYAFSLAGGTKDDKSTGEARVGSSFCTSQEWPEKLVLAKSLPHLKVAVLGGFRQQWEKGCEGCKRWTAGPTPPVPLTLPGLPGLPGRSHCTESELNEESLGGVSQQRRTCYMPTAPTPLSSKLDFESVRQMAR